MNPSNPPCSVIIVTYNSEKFLPKALKALEDQTRPPDEVIIVDTGSHDLSYLQDLEAKLNTKVIIGGKELGFCKGNNIGKEHLDPSSRYVFFLNPDAFPFSGFIENAIDYLEHPANKCCAAVTGKTLGYDIHSDKPKKRYDTTGIFSTWYGKWYDRGQGMPVKNGLYNRLEEIPAICGALFFCRRTALEQVKIRGREIFDESFYMYKEDIDLSLRLRKLGWKLIYHPDLVAYHCRGWSPDRKHIPRKFRLSSAKNELHIHLREKHFPGILFSTLKLMMVRLGDY